MTDPILMCSDCLWRGKMSMSEWMQHLGMFPTHMPVMQDLEEKEYEEELKS